jgi:general secretion pathway protein L
MMESRAARHNMLQIFRKERLHGVFSNSSLGIDFRPNLLIFTLLKRSFRRVRLVDYEIHPLVPENQREEREAQILNLINTFISKHHLGKEKVSISIPREKAMVRFITLPVAAKENLRKVVEYEVPQYTPFERGEVCFDYKILKVEREMLRLFAVFMKKIEMDFYLSLLKKIGIEPISIQIPTVGALNLFYFNKGPNRDEIAVLLDVAEPFFEMNLIQGEDWRESFHLPLPREKRELKMLNTFKRSGLGEEAFSKSEFFVYGLDTDATLLAALKELNQIKGVSPPPLNQIEIGEENPIPYKIYPSIGVPLKGLVNTSLDLNLLPFEMRKKVRQIGRPLLIILASLAFLLTLTWGGGTFIQYRNELNTVNAEIKKRRPEVEALEILQKQKEEMGKEILGLQKIQSEEISKMKMLEELTRILPETVWIWNLKYNGKEIELSGFADSASELIPLLDRSPFFEKVEFLAPVTKEIQMRGAENKEKERFRIKMKLEGRR